jgi:hypothetical protein
MKSLTNIVILTSAFLSIIFISQIACAGDYTIEQFKVSSIYKGKTNLPEFSNRDKAYSGFRTRIRDGLKEGPNFAGHFSVIQIGCGAGCSFAFIADNQTGQVFDFPLGGEQNMYMKLSFKLDSRLIVAHWGHWEEGHPDLSCKYLKWTGKSAVPVDMKQHPSFEACKKPSPQSLINNIATNTDSSNIDQRADERRRMNDDSRRKEQQATTERERQQLAEERRRLEDEKRQQRAESDSPNKQPTVTDSRHRLALVIGNATYKNSPLRNPTNDADLISNALASSGFIVSRYDNLTYSKMREVVRIFGEKLNRGDVGLFYFSGHAVQYRGKNYLLPINEDLKHADEIPSTAMDIDFVLAKMETAKNDLNIVILDACRNNPLGFEARNLDRGLMTISAAKGTFIAFATSPGNVALDGTGRNSPYTKNLAQAILKGGLTLEQVFKETRRNVISETNSQQVPWENSSMLGDFYFK